MKKVLNTLLIAMAILLALVACSLQNEVTDELVSATLTTTDNMRSLVAEVNFDISKVTTWKYTAEKADNGLKTGATTTEVELVDGKTELLSQGSWNFNLYGYMTEAVEGDEGSVEKLICSGTIENATVIKGKSEVSITVKPSQTTNGMGAIVIKEDISIVDKNGTPYDKGEGKDEYTKTVKVFDTDNEEVESLTSVPSGLYKVVVTYSATAKDRTAYTATEGTKYINVYDNLTTTVSGTVVETVQSADISKEGFVVADVSSTVEFNENGKNASEETFTVASTPVGTDKSTTVVFPEGALKKTGEDSSASVKLTVQSTSVETAESTYQISATEGIAVAGFDFSLDGADSSKFETDTGVIITTYIDSGLGEWNSQKPIIKVEYLGTNTGETPEIISYNNSTGELKFKVYHFSQYCIVYTDIEAINETQDKAYKSFTDALAEYDEGDTIILQKDITLKADSYICITSMTLDFNGKTMTRNNNQFIIGYGNSFVQPNAVVTFKNGTLNSEEETTPITISTASLKLENMTINDRDAKNSNYWGLNIMFSKGHIEIVNSNINVYGHSTVITGFYKSSTAYAIDTASVLKANDVVMPYSELRVTNE